MQMSLTEMVCMECHNLFYRINIKENCLQFVVCGIIKRVVKVNTNISEDTFVIYLSFFSEKIKLDC